MQAIADTGRAQAQLDADFASFDQAVIGEAYMQCSFMDCSRDYMKKQ